MEIFKVIFLAFFLNNVVLTHFLGVRSVLWKNDQIRMSFITGGIMAIIMIPVNSINFLLQKYIRLSYVWFHQLNSNQQKKTTLHQFCISETLYEVDFLQNMDFSNNYFRKLLLKKESHRIPAQVFF